ncbi:MAG: ferrochelatase [Bacteroidota bacterium]
MKKGILLINLGTPNSPSVQDVRHYLDEFLMDERVIDINPILRALLVKCVIVPFRAPASAKLYQQIWNTKTGSPLLHHSKLQQQLLKIALGDDYLVELAMRYQNPSIEMALKKFQDNNINNIKIIPLFPQYASATIGSVYQKVMDVVSGWQTIPQIDFAGSFHDHPLFITALAQNGKKYQPETYDHVLFSFHGLPQRQLKKCDNSGSHCLKKARCCEIFTQKNSMCYSAQSYHTAKLIAAELNIPADKYTVCFQSRLGKTPWIEPYTSDIIGKLAKAGKKHIMVFCPAFVADCLETIHEIGHEYREAFIAGGGEQLQLVESLNSSPLFIELLKEMAV